MAERRDARGLIDSSIVIDLESVDPLDLPREVAVSSVTMAELAAGLPLCTRNPDDFASLSDLLDIVSV